MFESNDLLLYNNTNTNTNTTTTTNNNNNNNNDFIQVPSLLAGQRSTNWGHNLYHSKVDGDLLRQTHT